MFASLTQYEVSVIVGLIASGIFAAGSTLAYLVWWLGKQFTITKSSFYNKLDSVAKLILDKLEYHERHDDARFESIRNDIWEMRLHNAAQDKRITESSSV
jgi:hypothetical protein